MTALYGTDAWRQAIAMDGDERRRHLHNLFRDQLIAQGSQFVRSFEIHAGPSNGYHLFFGTKNELGLSKMKEAMWSLDPVGGQRFSDSTTSDQRVLFQPEVDTRPLLHFLRAHFGTGIFTIEQADRFVLLETPYVPSSHLRKKTLRPAERDRQIEVVSARSMAGSYPAGTRLRFVR